MFLCFIFLCRWGPSSVVAYVLYCDTIVSEFELRMRYEVYFLTYTYGKGMSFLTPIIGKLYHNCSSKKKALALNNL